MPGAVAAPNQPGAVQTEVLRSARLQCWEAKQAFFDCQEGAPPQPQLQHRRRAFEDACPAAWVRRPPRTAAQRPARALSSANGAQVRHFDALHSQQTRVIRALQTNINASASKAAGQLAGRAP